MDFKAADYSVRDLATSPGWLHAMLIETLAGVAVAPASAADIEATIASLDPEAIDPDRVESALLALRALGRELRATGQGAPTQHGTVTGLFTSDGGIPKLPVPQVEVNSRGLVGDRQGNRKHHGRPFQAVCLWSTEVIAALASEGHPIAAGLAGENITVSGIDWTTIRPGVRLIAGTVELDISGWATPCRKNDQWFLDRSDRIDADLNPGWSRAYAWVRTPGSIALGDAVVGD